MLNNEKGWRVNHKRVEKIWRREGLKVPKKQSKRSRLWLNDGSCIRLRPEHKDHAWSYDFMVDRTTDGRAFKILNIIDEFTRECLAILVARKIKTQDVIDLLFHLFIFRGIPEHLRSDNGPEFTAKAIRAWLNRIEVKTLYIEPGSPLYNIHMATGLLHFSKHTVNVDRSLGTGVLTESFYKWPVRFIAYILQHRRELGRRLIEMKELRPINHIYS